MATRFRTMKSWIRIFIVSVFFGSIMSSCTACQLASGDFKAIQDRVDALEQKAIKKEEFTADDKAFLSDLYSSLVFGGRVLGHREAADMLARYLEATGEPLRIDQGVYLENRKVQAAVAKLKARMAADLAAGRPRESYASPPITFSVKENPRLFYFSNVFVLRASPAAPEGGRRRVLFRVELEARFISYDEEKTRFGRYAVHRTPFNTNARGETFTIDDGLSQYLTVLGLAKEFVYFSEWTDAL
jgi:hypothetical protein